ncbi:MAG TPA: hypothetical protein VGM82_09430 [Gemmatimonadaceae bacterium]|jgi:hypothetical protein
MQRDADWDLRLPFEPRPVAAETAEGYWTSRTTFDACVALASSYYARIAGRATLSKTELARELAELIKQLDFLLKSCYVLHEQYFRLQATNERPSLNYRLERHTAFALDLYASMFYYAGHRAQTIALSKKQSLPGFGRYKPAVGVRNVRNTIVEHPDPDTFVSIGGTAVHSHHGPRLRPMRDGRGINSNPDGWLFPDAVELERALSSALIHAHQDLNAKPGTGPL